MKNTRFNVQRGAINDSDSYASEIGTTTQGANSFHNNSSIKQSVDNFGTLGKLTEKSSKVDEKSSGKNQENRKSQKNEPTSLHDVKESGRSSSSSSNLSSSNNSTISSHLSGDEDQQNHHIKDVITSEQKAEEKKSGNGQVKVFNPIREAISE